MVDENDHARAISPIKSAFASVRFWQRVVEDPGARADGLAMAYALMRSAEMRWRHISVPPLLSAIFVGGCL